MTDKENQESLRIEVIPERYMCPICKTRYNSMREADMCRAQGRREPLPTGSVVKFNNDITVGANILVIMSHEGATSDGHKNSYDIYAFRGIADGYGGHSADSRMYYKARDNPWIDIDGDLLKAPTLNRLLSESEIESLCQESEDFVESMIQARKKK